MTDSFYLFLWLRTALPFIDLMLFKGGRWPVWISSFAASKLCLEFRSKVGSSYVVSIVGGCDGFFFFQKLSTRFLTSSWLC